MTQRSIGASRWQFIEFVGAVGSQGGLARAIDPDGNRKLMHKIKLRRRHKGGERKCKGCGAPLPSGTFAWSSIADNGLHRMDRFCLACIGEP